MKAKCTECNWIGQDNNLLSAPNPFNASEIIRGCPDCKSIESCNLVCDELGCKDFASCGTPTKNGYRHTCWKHMPIKGEI
jgi:hypothetical protein